MKSHNINLTREEFEKVLKGRNHMILFKNDRKENDIINFYLGNKMHTKRIITDIIEIKDDNNNEIVHFKK